METLACKPDSSRDFLGKGFLTFLLTFVRTDPKWSTYSPSHIAEEGQTKVTVHKRQEEKPGTPWIAQGLIMEPQKETKKLFHVFSLFPARSHIFDIPHRTSLLLQNKFWQPQEVHRIITAIMTNSLPLFSCLDITDSENTRPFRHIWLGWLPYILAIPLSPHASHWIATITIWLASIVQSEKYITKTWQTALTANCSTIS